MSDVRDVMGGCAAAVEAAASHLKAAGVGGHSIRGHVALLNRMANHLRADGALGKVSHTFDDSVYASSTGAGASFAEFPAQVRDLAHKAQVELDSDGLVTLEALNAAMSRSELQPSDRIALKSAMAASGRLVAG